MALVGIAVAGGVVMALWNWLIPPVIGWQPIGFIQALGLLILTRLLFGGFRGHHHGMHRHWHHQQAEKMWEMTPEEREKFKAGMKGRCGWHRKTQETTHEP